MKKISPLALVLLLIWSCSDNSGAIGRAENDIDAVRNFLRSALDGKYKEARKMIVSDSSNVQIMENIERSNTQSLSPAQQRSYRESQIVIHDTRKLSDSATVVIYSNTYMKKKDSLKAVQTNTGWLIDLKYSFLQNKKQP